MLYRLVRFSVTFSDPNYPNTQFSTCCVAFHIFGGEWRQTSNLIGRLTVASAIATDGKPSLKEAWLGHVNHLVFGGHQPRYFWNDWSFHMRCPAGLGLFGLRSKRKHLHLDPTHLLGDRWGVIGWYTVKILIKLENTAKMPDMLLWSELPAAHCNIHDWRNDVCDKAVVTEKSGRQNENKTNM